MDMNPKIDVMALEEMLKFLINKFGGSNEGEGESMLESNTGESEPEIDGISESLGGVDDDYVKEENMDVRIPKHKRPKKMAFSLSELAIGESRKKPSFEEIAEEIKPKFRKRGR